MCDIRVTNHISNNISERQTPIQLFHTRPFPPSHKLAVPSSGKCCWESCPVSKLIYQCVSTWLLWPRSVLCFSTEPLPNQFHWKQSIVNLRTLSLPMALQVVIMASYSATSDEKVVNLHFVQWLICSCGYPLKCIRKILMFSPWLCLECAQASMS